MTASPPYRFSYTIPRRRISAGVLLRVAAIGCIAAFIVGAPFYLWATMPNGVIRRSGYFDVDCKALASFELDQQNATAANIPARFRALEGKRVAIVGQMWAPNYNGDGSLTYFQLTYSRSRPESRPPLGQEFINCVAISGAKIEFQFDAVRVFGIFHVRFRKDPDSGQIKSVYRVDVDRVELE
jgi:hypothetical protein